jgi:uncharacterized protein YgbK (DUF1537 family)
MMLLGCIADDFTGATDLANMLVRGGMRTIQTIGIPNAPMGQEVDAVVIALKSRTIDPPEAVAQSLAALAWLKRAGCIQVYFKYCSTFDSTPKGNIGPVTDALMHALGTDFTIACPAFPEAGRTIMRGYLFVGDQLLSESGMKDHPLTPMTDANLLRILAPQTKAKVGLIRYDVLARGASRVREEISALRQQKVGIAIADALAQADLDCLAEACADLPLVTAGSGVGLAIANYQRRSGRLPDAAGGRPTAASGRLGGRAFGQLFASHQRAGRPVDKRATGFSGGSSQARGRSAGRRGGACLGEGALAIGTRPYLCNEHAAGGEVRPARARRRTRRCPGRAGARWHRQGPGWCRGTQARRSGG